MHLTIPFWFLISRKYVNLLIWLWPCIWPFYLAFSFLECMWTCWFDSDHASDHSILLSHFQEVCELVVWPCIWPFCLPFCFQGCMSIVGLTLAMPLTILFCLLISRRYVTLLISLWPCIWSFCLAFSLPACMWSSCFDSEHASHCCIWLSHFQFVCELVDLTLTMHLTISWFQEVCQLVDLTLTMPLTIPSCFLLFSLYENLFIWLWPCIWPFNLAFSFLACMRTCWFDSHHASDHSIFLSDF